MYESTHFRNHVSKCPYLTCLVHLYYLRMPSRRRLWRPSCVGYVSTRGTTSSRCRNGCTSSGRRMPVITWKWLCNSRRLDSTRTFYHHFPLPSNWKPFISSRSHSWRSQPLPPRMSLSRSVRKLSQRLTVNPTRFLLDGILRLIWRLLWNGQRPLNKQATHLLTWPIHGKCQRRIVSPMYFSGV